MILQLFKSRTMLFNIAVLVVGVVDFMAKSPVFADNPELLGIFGTILAIGNMILRSVTTTSLAEKKSLLSNN